MKYSRSAGLFFDTPLAMLPSKLDELTAFWQTKFAGSTIDFEDRQEPFKARFFAMESVQEILTVDRHLSDEEAHAIRAEWTAKYSGPHPAAVEILGEGEHTAAAVAAYGAQGGGMIAVLPLHGIMAPRMNLMTAMSGGTSTQMFAAALRDLVDNPQVKAIIIDTDSPGGSVYGTQELANAINSMRGTKPIVASINFLAASAAYWAVSQTDEIVASASADLGHIGVAALLVDRSGEADQAGVKTLQVTAGKYKHEQAVGSDLTPWTDEQVQHTQARVNEGYDMFVASVARGRGVSPNAVRNGYGEGRVVGAKEALRLGMIDRIATLEETIQRFANGGRVSRRGSATLVESEGFAAAVAEMERDFLEGSSSESEEPRGIMSAVDPAEIETQHRELAYQYEGVTR